MDMGQESVAIVGVGCRLPGGVHHLDEAEAVFREGRDCVGEIPPDRWDRGAFHHADRLESGKTYVRHGGFVDGIDRFDPAFFGIGEEEARHMDPQQRLLLETTWHALEHGAQNPDELMKSSTGVFLAQMATDYRLLKTHNLGFEGITEYESMSDSGSISAGRIAHFLGLEGPCLTVDTACSGSLVALHLARQSILAGECDSALVAGVNAILDPSIHIAFSQLGLLSREGRSRAFDAAADGYVRSEGCVVVLLRRQSLAAERGDPVLASVVSTAVNHGGRSRTLTAPDGPSQERAIRTVLDNAGVSPAHVDYLEAHGTGTPIGDPIEMSAIANVFGGPRPAGRPLYVGSGKSNLGHLEAAAGLVGVVRAALSLDRETIYPHLHLNRLNPAIDLSDVPVHIPVQSVDWPRGAAARLAGVNSFGYSGTNAHALLREAPATRPSGGPAVRPAELLVLSAKSAESLRELADRWAGFLSRPDTPALSEAVFTAATGRARLRHRLAVTGDTGAAMAQGLRQWHAGRVPATVTAGRAPLGPAKVAFAFSGQGTQYPGMARELYGYEPVFAAEIDRCAEFMDDELAIPLRKLLLDDPKDPAVIGDTGFAQPAIFAVEYALAVLLRSWGIRPAVLIGHSIGEVVAAAVGGVLPLREAALFSVRRGRLMSELPREGKMLALSVDEDGARRWLIGRESQAAIAAVNGPNSVVVSGVAEVVAEIAALAEEADVATAWLRTSHAFHSPLMDPVLAELEACAADFPPGPQEPGVSDVPVISAVTGADLTGREPARHWAGQAREPVRFHKAVRTAVERGCTVIVEVGAHPALGTHVAEGFGDAGVTALPTLRRDRRDVHNLLTTAGSLFTAGAGVDLAQLFRAPAHRRTSGAPQYPFRENRYWLDHVPDARGSRHAEGDRGKGGLAGTADRAGGSAASDLVVEPSSRDTSEPTVHESRLTATAPWTDHRLHGATVFPATGYLEQVVQAHDASDEGGTYPVELTEVGFVRPLVLERGTTVTLALTLSGAAADPHGPSHFVFSSGAEGRARREHGSGMIRRSAPTSVALDTSPPALLRPTLSTAVRPADLYGGLREIGLEHGFQFATVREAWVARSGNDEVLGRVTAAPDGAAGEGHPHRLATMLDGCLQLTAALLPSGDEGAWQGGFVPVAVQRMVLAAPMPDQIWAHVRRRPHERGGPLFVDVRATDELGNAIVILEGVEFRHAASLAAGAGVPSTTRGTSHSDSPGSRQSLLDLLGPLSHEQRREAVRHWLVQEIRDILGGASAELDFDVDDIDPSLALLEVGLDSLRVTELQRRLQHKLGFRFNTMEALDYQSIEEMADFLLNDVLAQPTADEKDAAASTAGG